MSRQAILTLIGSIEAQLAALKQIAAIDPRTGYIQQPQQAPQPQHLTTPEEDAYIMQQFELEQQQAAQQQMQRQPPPAQRPYYQAPAPVDYDQRQQQPAPQNQTLRGAPNEQAVQRLMMAALGGGQ